MKPDLYELLLTCERAVVVAMPEYPTLYDVFLEVSGEFIRVEGLLFSYPDSLTALECVRSMVPSHVPVVFLDDSGL